MQKVPSDALVQVAEAFLASDVLDALVDVGLFAVRFGDGALGFCDVEPDTEGLPALTLYMDGNGLASYGRVHAASANDSAVRLYQAQKRLDCLECTYEEEDGEIRPFLGLRRPFYEVVPIADPQDDARLCMALKAAMCLAEESPSLPEGEAALLTVSALSRDGFARSTMVMPEDMLVTAMSITLDDADVVAALRTKRMRGKSRLLCELVAWPYPLEMDGVERYPVGLLLYEQSTPWLACPVVYRFEEERDYLFNEMIDTLLERGVPRTAVMRDDLTVTTLRALFEQLGATVVVDPKLPAMDEAIEMLYARESKRHAEEEAAKS